MNQDSDVQRKHNDPHHRRHPGHRDGQGQVRVEHRHQPVGCSPPGARSHHDEGDGDDIVKPKEQHNGQPNQGQQEELAEQANVNALLTVESLKQLLHIHRRGHAKLQQEQQEIRCQTLPRRRDPRLGQRVQPRTDLTGLLEVHVAVWDPRPRHHRRQDGWGDGDRGHKCRVLQVGEPFGDRLHHCDRGHSSPPLKTFSAPGY
mmetsp:Transcript_10081/g.22238  ORF Transcript_10081/g.22238 Transcript_10081/m.22238 type:complete len:202 (+) Transcript_10081:859-1464(+)